MTTMRRLRVTWDGLGALPGLSTFYYGVASPNVADVVTMFNAFKVGFPTTLTITVPSAGDEIDDVTGQLTGAWTGTGGGTIVGTSSVPQYASGVGALVTWGTGVIHNGRRVKGRTFVAPLTTNSFDSAGLISTSTKSVLQAAVNAYVASGVAKGVWSRGRGENDGLYCAINSGTVASRVTALRSRRY
jgi:hypothetical protein